MKLKNFIKKSKKENDKARKAYISNTKVNRKPSRAEEKKKIKSTRRVIVLNIISVALFVAALVLFVSVYLYHTFIVKRLKNKEIISPWIQNAVQVSDAERILKEELIQIGSIEYSTASGALTLVIKDGPTVYFSDNVTFGDQALLLKKILKSLKLEDRSARVIDLRYNKPIVKF